MGDGDLKQLRKLAITIIGSILLSIGLLMIILPGPAFIIIPLALLLLNNQYPDKVKIYIKKFQRSLSNAGQWLDQRIRRWS